MSQRLIDNEVSARHGTAYWGDDHSLVATAVCIAALGDCLAFDRSCFYVGGGGQPPDEGWVEFAGEKPLRVTALRVAEGVVWHVVAEAVSPAWVGRAATLRVDGGRREALSRYHTVLHVLNTIAQRDYGAWITGAQIATDYARIDFQWEAFAPALREEIERKVNTVLTDDRAMHAYWLPKAEFHARPELLRTLEVKPPVI